MVGKAGEIDKWWEANWEIGNWEMVGRSLPIDMSTTHPFPIDDVFLVFSVTV
jgi:hypothetical protein